MNSLQNVDRADDVCVEAPLPSRWWWRELSIKDQDYRTGKEIDPDGEQR